MILPPKLPPVQVKFRWGPDVIDEVKGIAARTGRSMNEAGELLMRWAVERAKAELEAVGDVEGGRRKK